MYIYSITVGLKFQGKTINTFFANFMFSVKNKPLEVQNFKIVCLQSFSPYDPLLCLVPKTLNTLRLPFDILDQSSVARHVSFAHAACVVHSVCAYMHLYILMNYFL
jgi:hypothetical protein